MLRFVVRNRQRNLPKAEGVNDLGHGSGPQGRIDKMRKLVTALVRHERIEGYFDWVDESRGYTERVR
jgi:large subunit ribosomal protein L17